jgi:hypothetical protein
MNNDTQEYLSIFLCVLCALCGDNFSKRNAHPLFGVDNKFDVEVIEFVELFFNLTVDDVGISKSVVVFFV